MDSALKIVTCFKQAAADTGAPYPGDESVRNVIGLGLTEAMKILFPSLDQTAKDAVVSRYREHFLYLDQTPMEFFPDVETGLVELVDQGYTLAVATGKARRGLDRIFERTHVGRLFSASRCADESRSKPHPQMLFDILKETGHDKDAAIMVGDTEYDLQMANEAGLVSLAVSYGVHERQRLLNHKPLACLDSFQSVCCWLT